MAIRSGFFNSVNGDRKYDAKRFAEYFASFIGNGVFPNPSNNLQVLSNDDMTVTVKAGKAWINGYILINDDDYILTLDPADGVLNRIDRIVARYDTVDREIRLEVKKGTFASSPVAPTLQRDADAYELGLADVYIAAGVVSVTQANITDLRFNTELCGIVKGTVDQIDTTDLFAQYQTAFNDWFQELKDVLDDNTAANLLNLINQLDDDLTSHKNEIATQEQLGHVKAGQNITIDSDGTINAKGGNVDSVNGKTGEVVIDVGDIDGLSSKIIEATGSNSNGTYVRFGNGIQICFNVISSRSFDGNNVTELIWTFPATFLNATDYFVIADVGTSPFDFLQLDIIHSLTVSNRLSTRTTFYINNNGSVDASAVSVYFLAIGRWK